MLFSACKKDGAGRNLDRLLGRWNVESVAYIHAENGKETEREQYSNVSLAWEFRNDGTATVNFEGGEAQINWTATDDQIKFRQEDGQQLDFRINSLSKSSMDSFRGSGESGKWNHLSSHRTVFFAQIDKPVNKVHPKFLFKS